LFVTTKVWHDQLSPDALRRAFDISAWLLDGEGVIAIPKAGRPESQKADLEALTISPDDEDRAAIAGLPKDRRLVRSPFAPEWDSLV